MEAAVSMSQTMAISTRPRITAFQKSVIFDIHQTSLSEKTHFYKMCTQHAPRHHLTFIGTTCRPCSVKVVQQHYNVMKLNIAVKLNLFL
jgi:hypothetical protein